MRSKQGKTQETVLSKEIAERYTAHIKALPAEYETLLAELKSKIKATQIRAGMSVNQELILLYWEIGRRILDNQVHEGWGAKIIERLAKDLKKSFPDSKGFSARNLKYMRAFAERYPDYEFVQASLAQITWYHNIALMEKIKDTDERVWYAQKAIEHGWSRNILVHQIESGLYQRQAQAITNFERVLISPQSELAGEMLKDPYIFDFLTIEEEAREKELERGLLGHIREFLLELGVGFAFVGSQYHLEVGGEDFYLDLLFYHLKLRAYVVIDLKTGRFKPEYAGKMNFYLSAVDDLLRHPDDAPSVGIILCKEREKVLVEYALRDMNKPMGVSRYELTRVLPKEVKGSLPTIEELEAELDENKKGEEEPQK